MSRVFLPHHGMLSHFALGIGLSITLIPQIAFALALLLKTALSIPLIIIIVTIINLISLRMLLKKQV
ncbi:MAG: hypothetical protein KKH94_11165 [Candidatus Omnitrophica bacterium]|nr:hypothetical protein [Candidatus Omnitrophota bacterium]